MIIFLYYFLAAKVMLLINPANNLKAVELLTTLDPNFINQNVKVRHLFIFFLCIVIDFQFRHAQSYMEVCRQVIMALLKVPC